MIFGAILYLLCGSLGLDFLFKVQGFFARIGMFFAFSAFNFGILFLIYSIKYYLTIAVLLSFSRAAEVKKQNAPFNSLSLSSDLSAITLERHPFVSIHVAAYNEKRVIDRFLLAATSIEYDNFEIIIADDSTDETVQLLEQWGNHPRVKISHRNNREGFKGGALGQALNIMDPRTEYVIVYDADFIPYPDCIIQFLKYFKASCGSLTPSASNNPIAAVQGYQWHVLNKSENWITRGIRAEYAGSYVIERSGEELYQGLKQISGSVYMIRAAILKQFGWGTSLTEDFELTLKLYEQGYKVLYTPYIQAPAEAAATIKRLIRQRMRWAEGHSFNVKKMFSKLLSSPNLTLSEKLEFIYLAPYYLQAFFFLVGMFCWFMSEVIFKVSLPFWTEMWGWSLVFTNLFALPLMNMVGLFMEECEEKDYLGLISFIFLSYIVAPFQAFAAVKGFLEKEEGPWFRTPKTGRITDSFTQAKFYKFIKEMFRFPSIGISQNQRNQLAFMHAANVMFQTDPYLKAPYTEFRRKKWRGISLLVTFLVMSIILNYFVLFVPVPNAHAVVNPKIEQQLNIIDQNYAAQNTTVSPTDNSLGMIYFDSSHYSGYMTPTFYFEAVIMAASNSNAVTAALYSEDGTAITSASVNTTVNTSYTLVRSSALTLGALPNLASTTNYTVRLSCASTAANCGSINAARLLIVQTDYAILNTETQIEIGNNENTTQTSNTVLTSPKLYKYTDSKFNPSPTAYFEATLKASSPGNVTAELYNVSNSAPLSASSISTNSTSWTRIRSAAISSDTNWDKSNADQYEVRIRSSNTSATGYIANAKIVLYTNSSSGATSIQLAPIIVNTNLSLANTTYASQNYPVLYDPNNWKGATFAYSYASNEKSDAGTAYTQLYNVNDTSGISSSELSTNNTSTTLLQSGNLTMPASAKTLDTQIKSNTYLATVTHDYTLPNPGFGVTGTNRTWNHTTGSQNNRLLLVGVFSTNVSIGTLGQVSSILYNGTALSRIGSIYYAATNLAAGTSEFEMWYLTNPVSGNNTINVTMTQQTQLWWGSSTYYNVDQSTPIGTSTGTSNITTANPSLSISSNTTQLVIDGIAIIYAMSATPGAGQTLRMNGNTWFYSSEKAGSSSSTTMNWTVNCSALQNCANMGFPLNPSNNTGNTSIYGSWLLIDISSMQTPENLLFFIPLIFFLPKIMELWQKRKVAEALSPLTLLEIKQYAPADFKRKPQRKKLKQHFNKNDP
ncbi:glycosyltransferase family 2 protein [Dictyobacter formicarum]|uniref:Glycosyltransferase 2-like domain-containing protein n=1 Tax=Dictyobacter formicarum TaxID=2778368 RepID=A0ABQ3VGS2_9CHLR|nr:glycosyltransferase family 2 protein [Dictyobacter formicarum]GHO85225.1 hypothetical protein KSZ_32310 [Dictyobacter formicarum]